MRNIKSLNIISENGGFFLKIEFFSELKKLISDKEYEDAKFLFNTLKVRNISDMNDVYDFQGVIILCEIFENRANLMHKKYGFNPLGCNSGRTLSNCVQRNQSKVIIAQSTCLETIELFEKTLNGDFSCISTRVAFDTKILMPNWTSKDFDKTGIDDSFNKQKKEYLKVQLNDKNEYHDCRVASKILKMDENN